MQDLSYNPLNGRTRWSNSRPPPIISRTILKHSRNDGRRQLRTFVNVIYARIVIYTLHVFFNLDFIYTLLVLIFTLNVYIFTLNVLIYTLHCVIFTLNVHIFILHCVIFTLNVIYTRHVLIITLNA